MMQLDREHSPERQAYWVERAQRLGIYSLINRGLLPRYADFSPALSSLHPQPIRPKTRASTPTPREHEVASQNQKPRSPSSKDKPEVTKTPHASEWALNASSQHDDWVSAPTAQIHIVNGRVLEGSTLQSLLTAHPHHVIGNAVGVIQYLERTALLYVIDLIVLDSAALATLCSRYLPPWTALPTRRPSLDVLLPAIANWAHVHALYTRPGRRYMGLDGHWVAIVKIQATWRMARQRNKYMETCVSKTAAKVILGFRRKCLARAKFYERVMKQLEAHTSTVSSLRTSLLSSYANLHTSAAWHLTIHLPSASLPDRIRFMMKDVTPYQTYHAGRLASALSDRARVIYISPLASDPLIPVAMRYLARSTRYPRAANRTQVLVPEVLAHAPRRAPMSLSAYASAAMVNKVRETLAGLGPREGVLAVLVPYLVDAYDVRAASLMGVPMLALGVGRQEYFASRVGYFELVVAVERKEMEVAAKRVDADADTAPTPRVPLDGPRGVKLSSAWPATHPHVLGIEDEARVWTELASLVLAHPKIARWMLKIRDEAGRRGVVVFHRKRVMFGKYVERLELHEVVDKMRAVPEAFTFMPPRYVVDAFGHPAQLYTLQQLAPDGGNGNGSAAKVVRRKAPIHLIRSNLGSVPASVSGSRTSLAVPASAKAGPATTSRAHSPAAAAVDTPATTRPTTSASHQTPFDLPANTTLPTPAYPTVSAYLSSFCKSGGIIEALIDHPTGLSSTSSRTFFGTHIELHPTGELQVHATWESIPLHDFDQCLLVLPARQIPPDVLVARVLKLAPALIERGLFGHLVVEFLAYMDQQPAVDLFCIDVKPYWSDTASLAGLAKIVMDARVDFPSMSGLTGKPLVRQRGRGGGGDARVDGMVSMGEYVTDLAHLRPANLRMATQAKWLDMDRLNAVADQVVKEQGLNTGEEVRCAVVLSGWVSSGLKEVGWVTMNATLQACEAEMNDTMRRGVLFLGDPHKSALAIDRTVTQCIQSLRDALLLLHHRFQASPLSEHSCNLHSVCDLLNRMQPVYSEIELPANPLLAADLDAITVHTRMHRSHDPVPDTVTPDAYFAAVLHDNVPWMKSSTYTKLFSAPAAPAKDSQEEQSPEAKRTAEDMYAAALLAQEIYNLGRRIAEFSKQGASMTKFNTLLNAEIMDTEDKRKVRKKERKRDVKRSLRSDREAAMRLAAGGMSVAEAEAEKEKGQRRKSAAPAKGAVQGGGDKEKQPQPQAVGTSVAGGGGPQIVVDSSHQKARHGGGDDDSDSDSDSSDSSSDGGPLSRSSGNTRSPVELLAAGVGGGGASTKSVFSSTTLAPPTASQGKLGGSNVLKLMRGMFERVQEKVASSHHVDHHDRGSGA